ncbi:S8 family serine peptidase [Nannocystaceae bacterium ST9]
MKRSSPRHFTRLAALTSLVLATACSTDEVDPTIDDELAERVDPIGPIESSEAGVPLPADQLAARTYGEAVADLGDGLVAFTPELTIIDDAPIDPELADRPRRADDVDPIARDREIAAATTEAVVETARQRGRDPITFIVNLPEQAFDFTRLAVDEDDVREAAIAERHADIRGPQAELAAAIERLGGRVVANHWVVNAMSVESSGDAAVDILALPGVVSASIGELTITPGARYDGTDTRTAVRSQAMNGYGYWGQNNGRTASPTSSIKVGVFDVDPLNTTHVGWLDWTGGPSRVASKKFCDGSCTASAAAATGAVNHGTRVTSVAAGSIDEGQDPNFPGFGTAAQLEHSWSAAEANIYFYWGNSITAIEAAIADGVDVLNMSVGISCSAPNNYACSPLFDCGNINTILRNGLDAGMLGLACAGNGSQGGSGSCDLWWPGYRPETLAVNALDTSNDAIPYHDTVFTSYATTGPIPIVSEGGVASSTPGVDLVAPGETRFAFGNGSNDYFDMNGCSNATPVVTGAVGVLREAFKNLGWLGNDARALMVNALLMGDASNGTANGEANTWVHASAGYGRFHGHIPSDADMAAPWGWGWRWVRIYDGQELRYSVWDAGPESNAVTEWKMAATWDAPNLNDVPDIIIRVVDTCNGDATVASDYSYALRKRLHLTSESIGGRCLEMRVQAWDVPPEGTVVYMADYFHGGDTNIH